MHMNDEVDMQHCSRADGVQVQMLSRSLRDSYFRPLQHCSIIESTKDECCTVCSSLQAVMKC